MQTAETCEILQNDRMFPNFFKLEGLSRPSSASCSYYNSTSFRKRRVVYKENSHHDSISITMWLWWPGGRGSVRKQVPALTIPQNRIPFSVLENLLMQNNSYRALLSQTRVLMTRGKKYHALDVILITTYPNQKLLSVFWNVKVFCILTNSIQAKSDS